MYDLKQAGCQWQKKISRALEHHSFKKLPADENVLIYEDDFLSDITVMLYVDDIKMICKSIEWIQTLKNDIVLKFEIDNIDSISYYLEIKMMRDCEARIITLCQEDY